MRAVTLKDIASETGVSTTTVSIILNNKASHISKETKELVIKTAKKMGYRPNRVARSLVSQSTQSLGLILPDISNPFFGEIAKGVCDEATQANYTVSILNANDNIDNDIAYIDHLLEAYVDGIIIAMSSDFRADKVEACIEKLRRCPCPVALIDRSVEGDHFITVSTDSKTGAYLATEFLIQQGHQNIGCITSVLNSPYAKERFYGYVEALQQYGLRFNSDLVYEGEFKFETGVKGAEALLKKGVTALFAFNDLIALGAYRAIKEHKLNIPQDISVVGYDDQLFSSMLDVPLTTVHQPSIEIGQTAAKNLIKHLAEQLGDAERNIKFEPKLIVRDSTKSI